MFYRQNYLFQNYSLLQTIMYRKHLLDQFDTYQKARDLFSVHTEILLELEKFIAEKIASIIENSLEEIRSNYDEASYLYPFWQNYPPEDRGRQPIKDQFPWIEVGEHAVGRKISRSLGHDFEVRDLGLPSGSDERVMLSSPEIARITGGFTDSVWVFIDIKSIGPRDDADHAVLSQNQVSGDGIWVHPESGLINGIIQASGKRKTHDFHVSMPPLFVTSSGKAVPTIILIIKPVYSMIESTQTDLRNNGQPLSRIDIISIPNGILLSGEDGYLQKYPSLFHPGKDDKKKDVKKLRARISFSILRKLDSWRYKSIKL
jgi:hypothetical protein